MADYILFIDDERDPHTTAFSPSWRAESRLPPLGSVLRDAVAGRVPAGGLVVARNFEDACAAVIEHGYPDIVFFDHDLGVGKTGHDFAKWLVERDLDTGDMPADFRYYVHSANPIGRSNIAGCLDSYLKHRARELGMDLERDN